MPQVGYYYHYFLRFFIFVVVGGVVFIFLALLTGAITELHEK